MAEPTNCSTCKRDLTALRYTEFFTASGKLHHVTCDDCYRAEKRQEYEKTGVLTTSFMMDVCLDAALDRHQTPTAPPDPAKLSIDRIQERVRLFEKAIWFGGLRAHLEKHKQRGESLAHKGLKLLTYVLAGRVLITIEDKKASISVITTDEKNNRPKMGIQGICATESQAMGLLERAERAWLDGHRTTPDEEVRMAGM